MFVGRIRGKIIRTVLCCIMYTVIGAYAHRTILKVDCYFRFSLDLGLLFVFCHFVRLFFFAFIVLASVSSVLRQEIGWEERVRNDLLCVE